MKINLDFHSTLIELVKNVTGEETDLVYRILSYETYSKTQKDMTVSFPKEICCS